MNTKKEWPKWIRIMFEGMSDEINGYYASAHNANMLIDRILESGIKEEQVVVFNIISNTHTERISQEQINKLYKLVEQKRKEKQEVENDNKRKHKGRKS